MKSKIALILGAFAVPVTAVLRVLQYMFIIDADGYFNTATALGKVLTWSLYGVYIVTALAALLLLVSRDRFSVRFTHLSNSVIYRTVCLLLGAVIIYDSGYRFGRFMREYDAKPDWIALFGVLTSIFFALIFFMKKRGVLSSIFGLFPPVYICARGITEFFASFEKAHVSESKLELLSVCMLALFTVTLSVMQADVNVKGKRAAALSLAVCAFAAPTSVARLIAVAMGKLNPANKVLEINWAVIQILFIVLAIIVLIRLQSNIYIERDEEDDDGAEDIEVSEIDTEDEIND